MVWYFCYNTAKCYEYVKNVNDFLILSYMELYL